MARETGDECLGTGEMIIQWLNINSSLQETVRKRDTIGKFISLNLCGLNKIVYNSSEGKQVENVLSQNIFQSRRELFLALWASEMREMKE